MISACTTRKALLLALATAGAAAGEVPAALADLRIYASAGERYFSLRDIAGEYGLAFRVPHGRKVYLQGKGTSLEFEMDSRSARLDDVVFWLHAPMTKVRGQWAITENDARRVVDPLVRPSAYLGSRGRRTVVLDPGHGGDDRGARGKRGVEEKRVVLDVAKRARVHLANAGFKVYLTRETDRYVALEERTRKAAQWGAHVFVSIHLNSAASAAPSGLETFVLAVPGYPSTAAAPGGRIDRSSHAGNRFDAANTVMGYSLQRALLKKVGGEDRGLRRSRFMVLKTAPCPAALVECGFVSNRAEEARFLDAKHREAVALALAKGIMDYADAVKRAQPPAR